MIDDLIDLNLKQWLIANSSRFVAKLNDTMKRIKTRDDYDLRIFKQTRRHLFDRRMNRLIKRLKKKYRFVYSKLIDKTITIISSIENLREMIKRSLDIQNFLSVNKFIFEKQNDVHERRIEINEKNRKRFFAIQNNMNTHTVIVNDYEIACAKLNIDFVNLLIFEQYVEQIEFETQLKSHQVVAFDWIFQIEKMLENAILTDDMKLSKTITTLIIIAKYVYQHETTRFVKTQNSSTSFIDNNMSFIDNIADHVFFDVDSDVDFDIAQSSRKNVANIEQHELSNIDTNSIIDVQSKKDANEKKWNKQLLKCQTLIAKIQNRKYKTNFIVVFSQTLFVWNFEIQKFFSNLTMKIFANSSRFDFHHARRMTLSDSMRNLFQYLIEFFDISKTFTHVILTFYIIFVLRTKYSRNKDDEIAKSKMRETRRRTRENDEKHDIDDDENINDVEDSNNEQIDLKRWIFVKRECFERVIFDETQKTKTVRFLITKQILSLEIALRLLLNATFMINKIFDFYDLLRIFWNEILTSMKKDVSKIKNYDKIKTTLIDHHLTTNMIKKYRWILNSYVFKKFVKSFTKNVSIDFETTNRVLFVIFVFCFFRRTFVSIIANVIDEILRIDHDIFYANWMHCEIEMNNN